MDERTSTWDITCRSCGIAIGQLVGGRFVHDSACALPRRIGDGSFRCCRCGGALQPAAPPDGHPEDTTGTDPRESNKRLPWRGLGVR